MSKGAQGIIKILFSLLVGVMIVPAIGIGVWDYLTAVGLSLLVGIPLIIVAVLFLCLRAGTTKIDTEAVGASFSYVALLWAYQHQGFGLDQIFALVVLGAVVRWVLAMIFPDYREGAA